MGARRDLHARRLDRTKLPVKIRLSPLEIKEGRFVIALIINTTKRHHNKQLQAQVNVAKAATRAKTDFLAIMSHKIRTPLTSILGIIKLLRGNHFAKERKTLIDTLQGSSNSLATIVTNILNFTKIKAGLLNIKDINFKLTLEVDAAI